MTQTIPAATAVSGSKPATTAVRCKVCGYITDAANVKEVCPACGVKAAMFEPLTEIYSDRRRKFLDLHIHPIIVHFPQAFSITLFAAVVMMVLAQGALHQVLADTVLALSVCLPFTAVASFVSGVADGRTRFKKLAAPFLRLKITAGLVFTGLSIINVLAVHQTHLTTRSAAGMAAAIAFVLVVCSSVLGKTGAEMSCARMPG